MKVLVILSSVLVVAVAQPAFLGLGVGVGGDAPDVAAVKAAHLATQAAEAARNTLGVPVNPILSADEPQVALAKATHLNLQAAEAARNTLGIPALAAATAAAAANNAARNAAFANPNGFALQGLGGNANIVIGPNGVPLDTPEVALAKAAHAVARAQTAARVGADPASRLALAAALGAGIQGVNPANAISQLQFNAALLG